MAWGGLDQRGHSLVDDLSQRWQTARRMQRHHAARQERQEERGDRKVERQRGEQRHHRRIRANVGGVGKAEILAESLVSDRNALGNAGRARGVNDVRQVFGNHLDRRRFDVGNDERVDVGERCQHDRTIGVRAEVFAAGVRIGRVYRHKGGPGTQDRMDRYDRVKTDRHLDTDEIPATEPSATQSNARTFDRCIDLASGYRHGFAIAFPANCEPISVGAEALTYNIWGDAIDGQSKARCREPLQQQRFVITHEPNGMNGLTRVRQHGV